MSDNQAKPVGYVVAEVYEDGMPSHDCVSFADTLEDARKVAAGLDEENGTPHRVFALMVVDQ